MSIRGLAVLFAIFIISVIVLADLGYLRSTLWFVNRINNLDKVLHFLLIGTLTYLVTAGLIELFPNRNLNWLVIGSTVFFLFVFTIEEFSQAPIRGRNFSLIDLAANYAGILTFGFCAWLRYRKKLWTN